MKSGGYEDHDSDELLATLRAPYRRDHFRVVGVVLSGDRYPAAPELVPAVCLDRHERHHHLSDRPLREIAKCLVGVEIHTGLVRVCPGFGDLTTALLALAFAVLICRFLFVRKIFLRV